MDERGTKSAELPSSNYALGEKRERERRQEAQAGSAQTRTQQKECKWSLGIPVDLSHISDDQKSCPESTM